MEGFVKRGLGHEDHVHLRAPGYRRLGDLLFEDLVAARGDAARPRSAAP
jgi:lysophospholipase L1-like esterase